MEEPEPVKKALIAVLISVFATASIPAQSPPTDASAGNVVHLSELGPSTPTTPQAHQLVIPAGTRLDIEAAYTVNSKEIKPGDLLSFRVLVPVRIGGLDVIPMGALVSGRVVKAKRGGHWGKAGKLAWLMDDVVAVDLTRVPLTANPDIPLGQNKVTGTSHGGEIATQMAVFAPLMMFAAPLVLMSGFKRGEDAVIPQGKRFVVYVAKETAIRIPNEK
jgi:hypothetical protein